MSMIIYHNSNKCDSMNKNGWVSIDFLLASMIIILTVPCIVAMIGNKIDTANSVHEITDAKVLAENVAEIFEMVYSGGRGCSIIFKMPATISKKHYNLIVNSTGIYVRFMGKIGTAYITPMRITNSKYGSNVVLEPNKTYNISNINDEHDHTNIIIKRI